MNPYETMSVHYVIMCGPHLPEKWQNGLHKVTGYAGYFQPITAVWLAERYAGESHLMQVLCIATMATHVYRIFLYCFISRLQFPVIFIIIHFVMRMPLRVVLHDDL